MHILVSEEYRYLDNSLWNALRGAKPPSGFSNNGCTASPDYYRGYHLWPACVVHDWEYSGNVPGITRKIADKNLRSNIWTCLRQQGAPFYLCVWLSLTYYIAVRRLGDDHFHTFDFVEWRNN